MRGWVDRATEAFRRTFGMGILILALAGCGGTSGDGGADEFEPYREPPPDRYENLDTISYLATLLDDFSLPQGPQLDGSALPGPSDEKTYGPFQEDFDGSGLLDFPWRAVLGFSYRAIPDESFPDLWRAAFQAELGSDEGPWLGLGLYGGTGIGYGVVEDEETVIAWEAGVSMQVRGLFGDSGGGGRPYWMLEGDLGVIETGTRGGANYQCHSTSLIGSLGWEFASEGKRRMGLGAFLGSRWLFEDEHWGRVQPGMARPVWEMGVTLTVMFSEP